MSHPEVFTESNSKIAPISQYTIFAAVGICIFALITWFMLTFLQPRSFHGAVILPPDPAPDFTLTSSTGKTIGLSDFEGKIVVLFFGYTYCPDVCPTTLFEMKRAMDALGKKAEEVQVIFISVDPQRDTPERLEEYVANFHQDFIGATGTLEHVSEVASLYGVFFEYVQEENRTGYLVNHTASQFLIDRDGRLAVLLPPNSTGEEIAEDVKLLLRK